MTETGGRGFKGLIGYGRGLWVRSVGFDLNEVVCSIYIIGTAFKWRY